MFSDEHADVGPVASDGGAETSRNQPCTPQRMKIAVFDTHSYDRATFVRANAKFGYELIFLEPRLTPQTAGIAIGSDVVCSFVNDHVDREVIGVLRDGGVQLLALRSAGYNHVDLGAAAELGLPVVRVPEYSPYAVAEHA